MGPSGKAAELFDIKRYGKDHDICSKQGFMNLMQMGFFLSQRENFKLFGLPYFPRDPSM